VIILVTVSLLKYPARTIFITAFTLFQVGEFSFLLSVTGLQNEVLSTHIYQYFLAISIMTMGLTPFILNNSGQIADFFIRLPLPKRVKNRLDNIKKQRIVNIRQSQNLNDHLVIIGYGINGSNLAKTAKKVNIPYLIIELDPDLIKKLKAENEPVIFGDASNETILQHVHIHKARVVVIAISDQNIIDDILKRIREISSTIHIIVRTRDTENIEDIFNTGANEVVPEEFETSVLIFTSV